MPGSNGANASTDGAARHAPTTNPNEVALRSMLRPLEPYLADESVREITIPRPQHAFLRKGGAWHEVSMPQLHYAYLKGLAAAMASYNEGMDFTSIMSLKLLNGERAQVMLPPAVLEGTISINIRKHSSVVMSLEELAQSGAFQSWRNTNDQAELAPLDAELIELFKAGSITQFLRRAVQLRKNIIIGGKTGSGKTTFARSLIELVPTHERLITIEDVHELYLPRHPNRVHLIYGTGIGQPSALECVAACMRSSPDRIFLSELRGPEAWDYLSALNTGHPGSITTTHANSARDTFERVAMLIKQSAAGQQMDIETLRGYLRATLDIALYYSDFKLVEVYFDPQRAAVTM
ncbi:P-type DNA transfer ATPase VirB11 [Pusillimonas caeni]|nr:P-type DNA transfer ATPase VirB11 [Pusillimonas caeni]